MNRAMFATLLCKLEGAESQEYTAPFEDVSPDAWYAGAVNWAYENGVIHGISDTEFAPLSSICREQAVTMIVQYLEDQGVEMVPSEEETIFADQDQISDYAVEPISIAYELEILTGYEDGTVRPQNILTRAEGVAMLMNLVEYLETA